MLLMCVRSEFNPVTLKMKRIFYYAILVGVKGLLYSVSITLQGSQYFLRKDLFSEIFLSSCCHTAVVTYCTLRLVQLDKPVQ